ncbi:GTPase [Erwinia piriflorinigrans]|uniref:COBW domain-containing protein 1 Cobalamin synthetase W domain-containing protein 1 n=1 Tax=Erwinia piriflorinigrans CFBP 5888 TaxID=1161919 RepID=V5Z4K2_9GAMM|nr:GTPase [Erwinia piriflorinigrans]CCG85888.1 COBW domain-containing protein 1 Cobalamin synthetase W domain-containing protein 1 [Erwinia piriflorinigrans CFBP 5888]
MEPIAVTILTGFLGAGKTTLLRHILHQQQDYQIAVIENEFAAVSVDDRLLGNGASQVKTLSNGCICCTRSGELETALLELLDGLDRGELAFDRLMIECTGMADPGPIIQTFFSHDTLCQRYLLDGVITLVDAVHAGQQMDQFSIAQSQVGYADRILLSKTDIAGAVPELTQRLQRINARAPIYPVVNGEIDLALLFDTGGFMLEDRVVAARPRLHFISEQRNDIASLVLELDYPLALDAVSKVMEELLAGFADRLLRYKGILWIKDMPCRLLFQGVQRLYSADWDREWGPDEQPGCALIFIGMQLPEEEIRAAFTRLKNA